MSQVPRLGPPLPDSSPDLRGGSSPSWLPRTFHILVVDDEAAHRTLCRTLLETAGYSCSEAGDGVEGLAIARTEPVDLVLIVDTYHHIGDREAYFRRLAKSIKPVTRRKTVVAGTLAPIAPARLLSDLRKLIMILVSASRRR